MALQKSITSERTGVTLGYHEVLQVSVNPENTSILVASYPDKAAKDAGKQFSDMAPIQVSYDQSAMPSGVFAWAQAQVLLDPRFVGATVI